MSESSTETTTATENKVYTALIPGVEDADLRTVTLAHPLTKPEDLVLMGLAHHVEDNPEAGIPVKARVRVKTDHANSLIAAGYVDGVDPDKPAEVAAVVKDDAQADQPAVDDRPTHEQVTPLDGPATQADAESPVAQKEAAKPGVPDQPSTDASTSTVGGAEPTSTEGESTASTSDVAADSSSSTTKSRRS